MTAAGEFVGIPDLLPSAAAEELLESLEALWLAQIGVEPGELLGDLEALKRWFDPIASGERLRKALATVPVASDGSPLQPPHIYRAGPDRVLITPEGRAAIEILRAAFSAATSLTKPETLLLDMTSVDSVANALAKVYRSWSRRRLDGVVGLLRHETATLRPGAAGLLLVLLINRNTAKERALPRPKNPQQRMAVETAIREPALAWASAFTGRRASGAGMDLYRGWAVGELARRLGSTIHLGFGECGIYIDEDAVPVARQRLLDDLEKRPVRSRQRIPGSWSALMDAYRRSRPKLASLGLAFERPSTTQDLERQVLALASGRSSDLADDHIGADEA